MRLKAQALGFKMKFLKKSLKSADCPRFFKKNGPLPVVRAISVRSTKFVFSACRTAWNVGLCL